MNSSLFPRVLLVNATGFGFHNASATTLTNLFNGWPRGRLALVSTENTAKNSELCSRNWMLSPADVPIDRSVRRILGRKKARLLGAAHPGVPSGFSRSGGPRANNLHAVASAWADCIGYKPPTEFWNWVEEFQPDLVYSILGNIRITDLVLRISRHLDVPVVPHFMDDWPATLYSAPLQKVPQIIMRLRLGKLLKRAPVGLSIGDAMSTEYEQVFGIPFEAFMNSVQITRPKHQPPVTASRSPADLTFMYVGGLHLDRWRSLLEIGKGISQIEEGANLRLVIHSPQEDLDRYGRILSECSAISIGKALSEGELSSAILRSDVLVHVESFDSRLARYTRLSVSTKIPQYMACAKPILVYAPAGLASSRYVIQSGAGFLVGTHDPTALLKAVRLLSTEPDLRYVLGQQGLKEATARHNQATVRIRFREVLAHACV